MYAQNIGDVLTQIIVAPIGTVNADGQTTGIDLGPAGASGPNYEGDVTFLLHALNTAGTNPTLAIKLQDSSDDSTYTDVTGGAFTGLTTTTVNGLQKIVLNRENLKRYVRVDYDIGGTSSPAYTLSIQALAVKKNPA